MSRLEPQLALSDDNLKQMHADFITHPNDPKNADIQQIIDADNALTQQGQLGLLPIIDVTKERSPLKQFQAAYDYVNQPENRSFSYQTAPHDVLEGSYKKCLEIIENNLSAINRGGSNYPFTELNTQNTLDSNQILELINRCYNLLMPENFRKTHAADEWTIKSWMAHQIGHNYNPVEYMGRENFKSDTTENTYNAANNTTDLTMNSRFYFDAKQSTLKFKLHNDLDWTIEEPPKLLRSGYRATTGLAHEYKGNSDYNLQASLEVKTARKAAGKLELSLRIHAPTGENASTIKLLMPGFDDLPRAEKNWERLTRQPKEIRQSSTGTPVNTRLLAPALNVAHALIENMGTYIKKTGRSRERLYRANLLMTMANTVLAQHQNGQLTDSDCQAFIQTCKQIHAQHNKDHNSLFSRIFNRTNDFNDALERALKGAKDIHQTTSPNFSTSTSLALAKKFNKMFLTVRQDKDVYSNIVTNRVQTGKPLIEDIKETFTHHLKLLSTEKEIMAHWQTFKTSLADAVKCGMMHPKTAKEFVSLYEKKTAFAMINLPRGQQFSEANQLLKNMRLALEKAGLFSAIKALFKIGLSQKDLLEEVDKLLNYHCGTDVKGQFNNKEARTAIIKLPETPGFKELVLSKNFNEASLVAFLEQHIKDQTIKSNIQALMQLDTMSFVDKQKIITNDDTLIKMIGKEKVDFLKAFLENTKTPAAPPSRARSDTAANPAPIIPASTDDDAPITLKNKKGTPPASPRAHTPPTPTAVAVVGGSAIFQLATPPELQPAHNTPKPTK